MSEAKKIRLTHITVNAGIFLAFFAVILGAYMPDAKGMLYSLAIAGFILLATGLTVSYRMIVVNGRKSA